MVYAYWIKRGEFSIPDGYQQKITCSHCGHSFYSDTPFPTRCPGCGADTTSTNAARREPAVIYAPGVLVAV